jgi:hypothetical protein
MASILNVDQINNAAGTSAVTIDASTGKPSFPNSVIIPNGATMPAGSVIQVVQDNSFADSVASSSAWSDTNVSLTITPSASSSKVLVAITVVQRVDGSGTIIRGGYRVVRTISGSTTTVVNTEGSLEHIQSRGSAGELSSIGHYSYLDSPATTSSVQYKLQMALNPDTGASAVRARASTYGTNAVLMEIAQ